MKQMIKKLLIAAAVLAVAAGGISFGRGSITEAKAEETNQETEIDNGVWKYRILEDGTAEITGYKGTETNVNIPESIGGTTVTRIGNLAFWLSSTIREITIPKDMKVELQAFCDCDSLETVVICDNADIGTGAFERCDSLKKVTIQNDVKIGIGAFYGCAELYDVSISESVTHIGAEAFSGTKWIENRRIEDPLVIVNDILIDGTAAEGNVQVPINVKEIGDGAFSECESLISVTMADGVTRIGDRAFFCANLLENIVIPKSVTEIGIEAFVGTKWLDNRRAENPLVIVNGILIDGVMLDRGEVIVPKDVTKICSLIFGVYGANGSIYIPDTVTEISKYAFCGYEGGGLFDKTWEYAFWVNDITIYGYADSAAEVYATENGFTFIEITDAPNVYRV